MTPPVDPVADHARQATLFYDEEAARYDALRYESPRGRRVDSFHKRVLQEHLFAQLPADAAVLELGCGTGRLITHFRSTHPGTVGIDASFGMLTVARRKGEPPVVHGDAYRLPFAAASLDAAYAILVVNLLADFGRAFAEIARVLKIGGKFLFNVPNLESFYGVGGLYVNLRGHTVGHNAVGYRYSHWFRFSEVQRSLSAAGLAIVGNAGQPPLVSYRAQARSLSGRGLSSLFCKSKYFLAEKTGAGSH
jgi:ubiquinone/menaquinone biosynthesis C-methylase UbiE